MAIEEDAKPKANKQGPKNKAKPKGAETPSRPGEQAKKELMDLLHIQCFKC
jgi:hypothetical protein